MHTKITDGAGVTMDGPDQVGLAAGVGASHDARQVQISNGVGRAILGGSVGRVEREQQGILATGTLPITEDMVRRARAAAPGLGLEPHHVRAMLEAALHG